MGEEVASLIPLRDSDRTPGVPRATLLLIIVNLAIFLYGLGLPLRELQSIWINYGAIPYRVTNLPLLLASGNPQVVLTLVTSQFLHAGFLHILANMWYLWVFGDNVEGRLGSTRFVLLYLGSGVLGNLAHAAANPVSLVPTIGASGAVAGVLGAYFLSFPRARILTIVPLGFFVTVAEVPALLFLLVWIGLQVFNGLAALGASSAQAVAWWAHIGGFVAGLLLARLLAGRARGRPPVPAATTSRAPQRAPDPGGRVLGLDWGQRRIGVAVSDELGLIASPLGYLERGSPADDADRLGALIEEHEPGRIVVGLPLHMAGGEGKMAEAAREFGQQLAERWGREVVMWDERLSSVQADRALLEADVSRRRRRVLRDGVAAALFLQSYLDRHRRTQDPNR